MPRSFEEAWEFVSEAATAAEALPPVALHPRTAELLRTLAPVGAEYRFLMPGDDEDDSEQREAELLAALDDPGERAALFAAAPELAPDLERLWARGGEFPAASGASHWLVAPPYRDADGGGAPERARVLVAELLQLGRQYRRDLAWCLRWGTHIHSAGVIGTAVALAVEDGDANLAALLGSLADGTQDEGFWSDAAAVALLRQRDSAAWARAHDLLRTAGGQEGHRQAIVTAAGEASLEAFIATLRVIVDEELVRFSSVVLVAGRWFGEELRASDRQANQARLATALTLLTTPSARDELLAGDAEALRLALWAEAVLDAGRSIALAAEVLDRDPEPLRRAVATHHLHHCLPRPAATSALVRAMADPDPTIAVFATGQLHFYDRKPPVEAAPAALGLLDRLPMKAIKLRELGPLPGGNASRSIAAGFLAGMENAPHLATLVARIDEFDAGTRHTLVSQHGERMAAEHREVLLGLIGDASSGVRDTAFEEIKKLTLTDAEALTLEPLLRRKAGDLRQQVLDLLEARGPQAMAAAADRLEASGNEQQRLGAADLRDRIASDPAGEPTEADAFGLADPSMLSPPLAPVDRDAPLGGPDVYAVLTGLDAFVRQHAATELTLTFTLSADKEDEYTETTTVGELRHLGDSGLPSEFDALQRSAIEALLSEHCESGDQDVLLARAATVAEQHASDSSYWTSRAGQPAPQSERTLAGMPELQLAYSWQVHLLLSRLALTRRTHAVITWALDAAETLLCVAPPAAEPGHDAHLFREMHFRQPLSQPSGWFSEEPDLFTDHQARRLWGLIRWSMDVADPISAEATTADVWGRTIERHTERIPRRPTSSLVTAMFDRGIASEADLIDDLAGARDLNPDWRSLAALTAPPAGQAWQIQGSDAVRAVAGRVRSRVVEVELQRGEGATAATPLVLALEETGGLDVLLAAIRALGKDRLHRGWIGGSDTRSATFSHLIRCSVPGDGETPEVFAARVDEAGASSVRLIEVACYAPQWAAHIEAALARPGFEDAVWWVHAHTKDEQWQIGDALRARWRHEIAVRSELTDADFTDGAVDVDWFGRVRERLGAAGLGEVLGAARYASSSGGHKRAELFALALECKVPLKELRTRITGKRHQDALRALGLRPLAPKRADADLRERYDLIQRFRRESKQFGSQRQESEGRAAAIALDNLARTAGYRDPIRLGWAMEAASTADLAEGVEATAGEVTVRLGITPGGAAELTVRRGDRVLKAVPAPLRKEKAIAALQARKTELRRTQSRVREGLESAMVRGDDLDAAELRHLREHVVLWPQLQRLVLALPGDGSGAATLGFPGEDGGSLVDSAEAEHPIPDDAVLRIAHPVDLLASGAWHSWQAHVLASELRQPFKQVFRELYVPVDAEADAQRPGASRRYAGQQVRPAQAQRLLTGRGWTVEAWMPPMRTLRQEGLVVEVDLELGWGTAAEVEPPAVELVRFRRLDDHRPVALADVPPRAFSEVMRDLDLVVSVAHASGVDPEPSLSTLEMRGALVRETASLLDLAGVRVEERRAVIDGTLGSYAVHLGSGQVSQLPGGAVCIVPVHGQQRGRIFLPFADDDPRTAEVLAKVLLLARDHEIKDPEILTQLRRRA